MRAPSVLPLFERYPRLGRELPYVPLGSFPTPLTRLSRLGEAVGALKLYIKRDDLSGALYGGNKVRKLEFLLARALAAGAKEVLTFGFAGSNHALATAVYAQALGLGCIAMLLPQLNARYVGDNLLVGQLHDAELHQHANTALLAFATLYQLLRHRLKAGAFPQLVAAGGSSALGTVGYVNAAFELKRQLEAQGLPAPEAVYLPAGSMGTAVGLALGLKVAGLGSRVVAVRVTETRYCNLKGMRRLFARTSGLLRALDPSFPRLELAEGDLELRHEFFGGRYARFTEEGQRAVTLMSKHEGLRLDGAYSAKALAALISDIGGRGRGDQTLLFWHTYSARDFAEALHAADYHRLPKSFHRYFEGGSQPLDLELP
jgi:1-aminocyclopropane-1-carboxylate deaminase/D-cysteine desulfhydrase-like pyridoxal-dependent ACC family enzyme